ncbi:MAG: DUF4124 domain-containing protein [Gammaproteobacteria bacterium]|nr:DUF4124 domain-containing protein [Gammaproteobacteria bacterium]
MRLITIGFFAMLFFALLTLTVGNAQAREVQKWTDENGQVHYGDYTEEYKAKTLNVTTSNTSPSATAAAQANRNETRKKIIKSMQDKRIKKKEAKDTAEKELALKKSNCSIAKRQMATYKNAGRLATYDENGERRYIDDKERTQKSAAAQIQINKWCK